MKFSQEAEQSLLGAVLLDSSVIDQIEGIKADDFYTAGHREIWQAISRMANQGQQIDIITVCEALNGDLAYLSELAKYANTANVKAYARIIKEKSLERSLISAANEITALAMSTRPTKEKVDQAQSIILGIGDTATNKNPKTHIEFMADMIDDMQSVLSGSIQTPTTGFHNLDKLCHTLSPGNLAIVAARPSMGKTAFALNIAQQFEGNGHVLFCSQEMVGTSLAQRLLASTAGIPLEAITSATLTDEQHTLMAAGMERIQKQKIVIDEQTSLTLAEVRAKARYVKRKYGLGCVVIDYLQLMAGDGDTRHEEIAEISRGLKKLAIDMRIPVIALSQLNRSLETRPNKRPIMSDLRESGQIEQDADIVLMLYRDEIYDENSIYKGIAEVICRKNRQGRTGTAYFEFNGDLCRFTPYTQALPKEEKKAKSRGFGL
jgi:replicative DNA helicase